MNVSIPAAAVERFREAIGVRIGLLFDDSKVDFLAAVLQRRLDARRCTVDTYLEGLDSDEAQHEEIRALAHELTVPESYFFRHFDQFRAFAEVALPERIACGAAGHRPSILSAGCASGEEAYSLAIMSLSNDNRALASIRAVDISAPALDRARRGRFTPWALRETPKDLRLRWFRGDDRGLELDPALRSGVTFEERNLVRDDPELWRHGGYDVVFCRNVLMYFTADQTQRLIDRLTLSLAPGGFLFLGHAETLRGLTNEYHLRHSHGTFYYQRKGVLTHRAVADPAPSRVELGPHPESYSVPSTWIDTVRRSSQRIEALAEDSARRPAATGTSHDHSMLPNPAMLPALDLLRGEQFADALDVLGRLPAEWACNADALLLRAALLTHSGKLAAAVDACLELLRIDEMNSGALYLLALCREEAGEREAAIDHYRMAAHLDPGFAMPRLHLGLLASRAGDYEMARRELGQALALLGREEAGRLLLFGGGFSRETLIALCRGQLLACGAPL